MGLANLIEADHALMLELADDISSEFASPEGKLNAFRKLSSLVDSHSKAEQATILDFARNDEDLREVALECMEDNALADEFANSIRQSDDLESWDAKAQAYCDLVKHQISEKEIHLLSEIDERLTQEDLVELSDRFLRVRDICSGVTAVASESLADRPDLLMPLFNEAGRVGYLIAWILGVPAWLLFVVFLIRGH